MFNMKTRKGSELELGLNRNDIDRSVVTRVIHLFGHRMKTKLRHGIEYF